jgi:hypothetical protein
MGVNTKFIRWKMTPMGKISIIIITIQIGVIIGITGIIKMTIIGIVDHDIKIIILIVLHPLAICNLTLMLITSIMGVIGIILVALCPKIPQVKIKDGPKCLMVIPTKACQPMRVKFQVG